MTTAEIRQQIEDIKLDTYNRLRQMDIIIEKNRVLIQKLATL